MAMYDLESSPFKRGMLGTDEVTEEKVISNETDEESEEEPVTAPQFKLEITLVSHIDCIYTFNFKATNLSSEKDLTNVKFSYVLGSNLNFISSTLATLTATEWTIQGLLKEASLNAQVVIRYTASTIAINKEILANITGEAKYDTNKAAQYVGPTSFRDNLDPCPPVATPCCEKCAVESEPIIFTQCEQSLPVDIEPILTSEGKEIKVHITLAKVCMQKDIVVGLELFERLQDGSFVRRALKVITFSKLIGGAGCAERECGCATFFIPPKENASDDPTCDQQQFLIKARAHHYNIEATCSCATCNI